MKMIEIIIDFGYMAQFENCGNFISFVKETIETKHNFKGIKLFDYLGKEIVLIGRSDKKTIFNLAMMASDIMDIVYEYNKTRREHGKSLFVVDAYTITNNNVFVSDRKYLCRSNNVQ